MVACFLGCFVNRVVPFQRRVCGSGDTVSERDLGFRAAGAISLRSSLLVLGVSMLLSPSFRAQKAGSLAAAAMAAALVLGVATPVQATPGITVSI